MTVYERVHRVLSELPAIGKDSRAPAQMGGYSFRGIEAITAELKPRLAEHGVFMAPETIDRIDSERVTGNNKSLYVTDVHVRYHFWDVEGDTFAASVWGQGSDSGDKAVSKAYTSAFKSMLAQVFCITDSETDTERHNVPESVARLNRIRQGSDGEPSVVSPPAPTLGGDTESFIVPAAQLHDAKARARSLRQSGIDVTAKRQERLLPPLDENLNEEEWHLWLQLLDELAIEAKL